MLLLLREIVHRKIQVSSLIFFRFFCFRQKYANKYGMHFRFLLYIWVRVDCRPTSQQIYKRTSSNLIRKKTGCGEYVADQLNVAGKNFAKYLFDDTDGKGYLEDICSMKGWSGKNAILNFFSRHDQIALHTKFHTCQTPPLSFFCK